MKRFMVGFILLSFRVGLPGMVRRMACLVGILAYASVAQGQVVEEGGLPVKGNDISGEYFSLSCPPRLVVRAGESLLLSCAAAGVSEEGIRYRWESVSGEGFRHLSAFNELSPLFTAPASGAGAEYVYRLTATGPLGYRIATVTVSVGGASREVAWAPGLHEECDPLTVPDEPGAGCAPGERAPDRFGSGPESEGGFLFPDAPGLPLGSGREGGFESRTPPRVECPSAVFLEELETGVIECRVSDVSGEEYLDLAWEPVGGTTRDYLDNPLLTPEDSPNPSVVAPEAPGYETLESFRSGETTSRYRYRLTATSRATGLSSFSEVDVFVSSNRPVAYCPLEVVVEEGGTVSLDCEGADPLSLRMDYDDDEEASVWWEWEGLWGTSTAPLEAADLSSPLFTAPPGSAGEEYHYIASMTTSASGAPRTARRKVTVRVVEGEEGVQASEDALALANRGRVPVIACENKTLLDVLPSPLGTAYNHEIACSVTDPPTNPVYVWTGTDASNRLTATNTLGVAFKVPNITLTSMDQQTKDYDYTVTLSAPGIDDVTETVTITVQERQTVCWLTASEQIAIVYISTINEGSGDVALQTCSAGVTSPEGGPYTYVWSINLDGAGQEATALTATDQRDVSFKPPGDVRRDLKYEVLMRVRRTAEPEGSYNDDGTVFKITLKNTDPVDCPGNYSVFEHDPPFEIACTDNGNATIDEWVWAPETHLTNTDRVNPTFTPPAPLPDPPETFTYTVTGRASGADIGDAQISVTVKEGTRLAVYCNPADYDIYEGTANFRLDCEAEHGSGTTYSYAWTPRGSTANTGLLRPSQNTGSKSTPLFTVPAVDADTEYEYTLTASQRNAVDGTEKVTIQVRNKATLLLACVTPDPVYAGTEDFDLDCTASGAPGDVSYAWTGRNGTAVPGRLSSTTVEDPTFSVPPSVNADTNYDYTLTATAENADDATADVRVQVLKRPPIDVVCASPPPVYEGSDPFALDCTAAGAPGDPPQYSYLWQARGSTLHTAELSNPTVEDPMFRPPDDIDADTNYDYTLTVSAAGVDGVEVDADVTVTVLNKPDIEVTCPGNPYDVYEGEDDFALDCEASGAPSGSTYNYAWTPRGGTSNTDKLIAGTNGPTPMFDAPQTVDSPATYEYTLTVTADNAEDGSADVTVEVKEKVDMTVSCTDPEPVYEESDPFDLDCSVSGGPSGSVYAYAWTAPGSASSIFLLSSATVEDPTFTVPNVASDTDYEYTLTVSTRGADPETADVTVTVLDKPSLALVCVPPAPVYEGADDFDLDCTASGAPEGVSYEYAWTGRGGTSIPGQLSDPAVEDPTFAVPPDVDADQTYEYTLTVSGENVREATADVTVRVLNTPSLALVCSPPAPVYEGSEDFTLECTASGAPSASSYVYEWTPRGGTADMDRLSDPAIAKPTFDVPEAVDADETYEYALSVSAANAESASTGVTVRVLDTKPLQVVCAMPSPVYEGSADFDLDCAASGAPAGSAYSYAWSGRGGTTGTDRLSDPAIAKPTFAVPETVEAEEMYEYLLTVSARNALDATAEVAVRVLKLGSVALVCASPPLIYEGSEDFVLACSVSGGAGNVDYSYAWTARGETQGVSLLSASDIASPTFLVPGDVAATTTYEYLLTARAEGVRDARAEVSVTVLNRDDLAVACTPPPLTYEGSDDFDLDCTASGASEGSVYEYVWTARGGTANTDRLIAGADGPTPTFSVPASLDATTTYEYLLTVSSENARDGSTQVSVTVLNRGAIRVVCADPPSAYEGSADFDLDCTASGAPEGTEYTYVWTARGGTANTDRLIAGADGPTPTFSVPASLDATTTYGYLLTVSAANAEDGSAEVTVTVLNTGVLRAVCADPGSIYEGSADFTFNCSVSGALPGSGYVYAWTARGSTANTVLLSSTTVEDPTFAVPDAIDVTTTYEYLLTVSAENALDATEEVSVTVLNKAVLAVVCADPGSVYEGAEDIAFDCSASGAFEGSEYEYAWTTRGDTQDTSLLSATDILLPAFLVPDEVAATTEYEYLLTVSAENADSGTTEVAVTVLNKEALAVACAVPDSVYEGSDDVAFDCSASGAPGDTPQYAYVWTARGDTQDTSLLSATDIASPTFLVPGEVDATTEYEYLLTVSAENAEDGSAEVTITVLNELPLALDGAIGGRVYVFTVGETITDILLPEVTGGVFPYAYTLTPALPLGLRLNADGDPMRAISGTPMEVHPRTEYTWRVIDAKAQTAQIAFFIEVTPAPPPPVAEALSLGVTISASPLRFGVQSAETRVSLDPVTDRITTSVSGPYHRGRMTISPDGSEPLDENGEMDLSIELASPVVLRREGVDESVSLVLTPGWSLAESCDQISSQEVNGLYTEMTLGEDACRLLRFGGDLDLTDAPSGHYSGTLDIILRSGGREETFAVEVSVGVVPAQRTITIGPGGVRFSTLRALPVGLTEEQNLSIYPDVAFLTEGRPNGVFELSNPSLIPLEVSVSARFGYTEATEDGREIVVEDIEDSDLGDLSAVVDIHPGVLVLMPGEKGLIRYGVKTEVLSSMSDRGYAAFFDVVSAPRRYAALDRMPEEVTGDRTARVTMRVPGVYVPGEGASQLRAQLLSISYVGSLSATFLIETENRPFAGEVAAYDEDGHELGRTETLVYTRSRVRIPLDRMPEDETVFLRFTPRGSGRAPLQASAKALRVFQTD